MTIFLRLVPAVFLLSSVLIPVSARAASGGCPCEADIVGDCAVECCSPPDGNTNILDAFVVIQCINGDIDPGVCPDLFAACDINCDGVVDTRDVAASLAAFQLLLDPCSVATGACCNLASPIGAEACNVTSSFACTLLFDGTYVGDDVPCDPLPGPPCEAGDPGACCCGGGICQLETSSDCAAIDPSCVFRGEGTVCAVCSNDPFKSCDTDADCPSCVGGTNDGESCETDDDCPGGGFCAGTAACLPVPPACFVGACCDPSDGSCALVDVSDCLSSGGLFQGEGTDCVSGLCDFGACCDPLSGSCAVVFESVCDTRGDLFLGDGSDCAANPCAFGACCDPNAGTCTTVLESDCDAGGDVFQGDGTGCDPNPCGTGACCCPDTSCFDAQTVDECNVLGCTFEGVGADCASIVCSGECPCDADVNPCGAPDGVVNIVDVINILECALDQVSPCGGPLSECDVNCDGVVDFEDAGAAFEVFRGLPEPCSVPVGACCGLDLDRAPPCVETTQSFCELFGGTYLGDFTACVPLPCDCNNNAISDDCDLACGAPGGACDVPGCGGSEDCNDNGVPDDCEEGACCFIAPAGTCQGGSNDGLSCQVDDECPGGACVIVDAQNCTQTTKELCEQPPVSGTFLGVCAECPTQNAAIIEEGDGSIFVHVIGPPVECPAPGGRQLNRGECGGPPFIDPWITPLAPNVCHDFGAAATDPIPAGFFGPGSDVFDELVCLKGGTLLVNRGFSNADTLIERSADPFDRCALPSPEERTVDIEIVALNLVGRDPITVTFEGGQNPEQWTVIVDLSPSGVSPGTKPSTLTATKTHCNSGSYVSSLCVQPRFTFSKVGDPGTILVLDTNTAGTPAVCLEQTTPSPWVGDLDEFSAVAVDACSDFHPAIEEFDTGFACDCNANGVRDRCDVEDGTSQDCNLNFRPDLCEVAPSAGCPQGLCGANCAVDVNEDCRPDECLCPNSSAPRSVMMDVSATEVGVLTANRFLIFEAGDPGRSQSLRVTMNFLPEPYDIWNGSQMWVGEPREVSEIGAVLNPNDAPGEPTFWAAMLECTDTPHAMDWSTLGEIHVFGESIVPSTMALSTGPISSAARYSVQVIDSDSVLCPADNPANFSPPLAMTTSGFGDTIVDCTLIPQPCGPPDESVDILDIKQVLERFGSVPGSIRKARAEMEGTLGNRACVDLRMNISDALRAIRGFNGLGFDEEFAPSAANPCDSDCLNPLLNLNE